MNGTNCSHDWAQCEISHTLKHSLKVFTRRGHDGPSFWWVHVKYAMVHSWTHAFRATILQGMLQPMRLQGLVVPCACMCFPCVSPWAIRPAQYRPGKACKVHRDIKEIGLFRIQGSAVHMQYNIAVHV